MRAAAGWQCSRCGRSLATGLPGQQRCAVPRVRVGDGRSRAAKQAFLWVLARTLAYW